MDIWAALGLSRVSAGELTAGVDDEERQPAPYKIVYPHGAGPSRKPAASHENWKRQEPVERIVNSILACAIRDGASDIHIEPLPKSVSVRYRIKGVLHDHLKLPMPVLEPLVTRFKRLGHLDLTDNAEQWGIIRLRVDERDYDLQISTQPTEHGERILLRLSGTRR